MAWMLRAVIAVAFAAPTLSVPSAIASESLLESIQTGVATYYARHFEGRRTASGDIFRHAELTAAHPSHPFGTLVRVTNLKKNRSVVVRITDRGPTPRHQRRGTIIDLSKSAAAELGMMQLGRVPVKVEVLEWGGSAASYRPRFRPAGSTLAIPGAEAY